VLFRSSKCTPPFGLPISLNLPSGVFSMTPRVLV
jgi:hypothetical protein